MEELSKEQDDFWTSVGLMQGGKNPSVRTQRLKDLRDGKITPKQSTPEGESVGDLLRKGFIINNTK